VAAHAIDPHACRIETPRRFSPSDSADTRQRPSCKGSFDPVGRSE
jgi:hypothetical protein